MNDINADEAPEQLPLKLAIKSAAQSLYAHAFNMGELQPGAVITIAHAPQLQATLRRAAAVLDRCDGIASALINGDANAVRNEPQEPTEPGSKGRFEINTKSMSADELRAALTSQLEHRAEWEAKWGRLIAELQRPRPIKVNRAHGMLLILLTAASTIGAAFGVPMLAVMVCGMLAAFLMGWIVGQA